MQIARGKSDVRCYQLQSQHTGGFNAQCKFSHALRQVHKLVAQINVSVFALYSFSLAGSKED